MTQAKTVLDLARKELFVKEEPPGSNRVKYNAWFYGRQVSGPDYPWCAVFVQWCFAAAGAADLLLRRTPSCGRLLSAAKDAGQSVAAEYRPGDVVFYNFSRGKNPTHCGIVESVSPGFVTAIEGNTGAGNDANGGQVQRRKRETKWVVGALRPRYQEEPLPDNTPAAYAAAAVDWAAGAGILRGDAAGDYRLRGPVTREQLLVFLYRFHQMNQ